MGLGRARKPFVSDSFKYILEISFQLDAFYNYINITHETIDKEIKQKIDAYENFLKEACPEAVELIHDSEDHLISINTKHLFYNSLFISLYSFLERKMYQLSKLAETNQDIKINDLSGDGIFKYNKYLKKIVHIDFEKVNTEWTEITKLNKLRNLIAHSPTAEIENNENNAKLIKSIKSIDYLTVVENVDIIEFQIENDQLLINFCKTIDKFLNYIYYEY